LSPRDERGGIFLADTDLFFYYLRGGSLENQAAGVIENAASGGTILRTSSEVYDDAITALRSEGQPLTVAQDFVSAMRSIPHTPVVLTAQLATDALALYIDFGGRGRLGYFDSFHVATAKSLDLGLITSDGYINRNARKLGVKTVDLSAWKG
jgi:predicted nucleic acid-binding protein